MVRLAEGPTVARAKKAGHGGKRPGSGRPATTRDDVAVKLDRTLASRAKTLAGYRGVPMAELLSELVRGPLDRAFAQMVREMEGKGGGS